ncbi:MAG: tetratricopeptide repeat protein, partial [Bacteroidales bacterium]|nr:tetratricopeptide repeat protein [Bacteroidales bacterium]
LVVLSLQKYEAQRELTQADRLLKEGRRKQAGTILHRIEPKVSTSEAFYATKARYEMAHNNAQSAYQAMLQLLNHTSHPSLYLDIAMISTRLNNVHEAETYFKTACGIEPHRFKPRVMLMDFYHKTGQLEKARQMAQTILDLKPKIDSNEVRRYKQLAQVLLTRS